jgi:hypothetical protein
MAARPAANRPWWSKDFLLYGTGRIVELGTVPFEQCNVDAWRKTFAIDKGESWLVILDTPELVVMMTHVNEDHVRISFNTPEK